MMDIIERAARVLAGQHFSRNADGAGPAEIPDSNLVDTHWRDFIDDAVAVLKTLREPDAAMIEAGELVPPGDVRSTWEAMVRAVTDAR